MVQFRFTVNRSFCRYPTHPITIPKRHYDDLVLQGLDQDDVAIVGPDGHTFTGRIRRSVAGWGEYFQMVVDNGHSGDGLSLLPLDQVLLVEITQVHGRVRAQLSRV